MNNVARNVDGTIDHLGQSFFFSQQGKASFQLLPIVKDKLHLLANDSCSIVGME